MRTITVHIVAILVILCSLAADARDQDRETELRALAPAGISIQHLTVQGKRAVIRGSADSTRSLSDYMSAINKAGGNPELQSVSMKNRGEVLFSMKVTFGR